MPEFDLKEVFIKAWGYEPPANFNIEKAAARKEQSDLGQPFYAKDAQGREHFLPVFINNILLPFAVIGINTKKTIVTTAMPERGGSVHEIISIDDYAINIKGILINDSNIFPEKDVLEIHKLFQINRSIELRNALTDIFLRGGIKEQNKPTDQLHQVVIKEINYPPVAGVEHAKPFEITCESDMIFTLEIE